MPGFRHLLAFVALWVGAMPCKAGQGAEEQARTVVHMLEYVGVDYPAFVKNGQVLDTAEYAEQLEFAKQSIAILEALPQVDQLPDLLVHARKLQERILGKADGTEITALANALRQEVIRAYNVAVAPRKAPDLAAAAALYTAHCASCHGASGHGDGPQAASLEPAPRNFHDAEAMAVRSPFGLYNTITLGVAGTSMLAYTGLTEEERWALAFHVADLRVPADELKRGEALWKNGVGKEDFPNLTAVVTTTPEDAVKKGGADLAAVLAWLTAHPEALGSSGPSPLNLTRDRLAQALDAYKAGQPEEARRLSISAYLEGFELIETALDNVDAPLRKQTEREMMALRSQITAKAPADSVAASIGRINSLLEQADDQLSGGGLTGTAAFLGSLIILLREGLEAILVLAAILAFVLKTGRRDALKYVHAGWIGAVVLGVLTWVLASYVLTITGANRELTEGITALLAAAMLLYVGWWLHNKSNVSAWQRFVKDKVGAALGKRTLWALAGISFLAVYRELFEIILFYETLFSQAGPSSSHAVFGGIGVAAVLLVLIGGAILKYSVRLPIGPFFAVTGWMLALMAVVFSGNGVAALQEAGVFDATFVRFITVPVLGIHPTVQGLVTQACVLALVLGVVVWGRMRMAHVAAQ
ncbi:MAG: cytochrome c/FTR1 family iron permease [Flavobacteriales bacterium]|nr:cytochrome c/FTR1 family iron permease [Flavobacteriales bacterium]